MSQKTDDELRRVIRDKHLFQEEAVFAAALELEKRGSFDENINSVKNTIIGKQKEAVTNQVDKDEQPIFFFHKYIIFLVSFLISPIIGGILFIINLIKTPLVKKGILATMAFIILYSISAFILFMLTSRNVTALVLFNLLSAATLTELLWKKYLPQKKEEKKEG